MGFRVCTLYQRRQWKGSGGGGKVIQHGTQWRVSKMTQSIPDINPHDVAYVETLPAACRGGAGLDSATVNPARDEEHLPGLTLDARIDG